MAEIEREVYKAMISDVCVRRVHMDGGRKGIMR